MQVGGLIGVKLKIKFKIDGICINKKARDEIVLKVLLMQSQC
jgi:hypothetical protein